MTLPPGQQPPSAPRSPRPRNRRRRIRWYMKAEIMVPLIVAIILAGLGITFNFPRIQGILGLNNPTSTLDPGLTSHPTPTPTPCIGKPTGGSAPFSVYPNYNPSGYVGDTGDITVAMQPDLVRFTYVAKGHGPHEWDYTYIDGTPNPNPAKFAGVLYLNPPDNFGTDSHCGFDLRGWHTLTWKAHSLSGSVYVEFVIGGVVWQWDPTTHTKVPVPYPDSLPRISLGIKKLTPTWQTFTYDLSAVPADYLRSVVAGFGWIITWDSNGGKFTGSGQPQTFIFEIQDITYE